MAYIDIPMRLHSPLISRFGKEFKYKARGARHAISAMHCLLPGFEKYMSEAHKKGLTFSIFVGGRNISQDELEMTKGTETIHLLPVIIGSKRAGLFQTILGVALIAAAMFVPGGQVGLGVFGAGGLAGGIAMVT
ncbi:hypothetical protein L7G72_14205 [Xenorhabdus bovienii]|uniref:hypothetical protein n=1 Tax=Xenorhabdus bovienii TaxID=40576 RepID=UPI001EDE3406|nr:hypothetical protein [Xenorhabdus bovienii]MCG3462978.1 hypothetical protein [Xenorhabdus bovienii]